MNEIERSTLGRRIAANELVAKEVVRKSREGETPLAVAAWLQEELLLFTEAGQGELEAAVRAHFLAEVPLEERLELHRTGRDAIATTTARQRKRQNAKERLEVLYDLQLGRLELGHRLEMSTGEPVPALGNEVEVARRIAMNIHEVEQVTGNDDRSRSGGGVLSGETGAKLGKLFHVLLNAIPDQPAPKNEPEPIDIEVIVVENGPKTTENAPKEAEIVVEAEET
jgi:predicted transposase YbfD/YdcC